MERERERGGGGGEGEGERENGIIFRPRALCIHSTLRVDYFSGFLTQ